MVSVHGEFANSQAPKQVVEKHELALTLHRIFPYDMKDGASQRSRNPADLITDIRYGFAALT